MIKGTNYSAAVRQFNNKQSIGQTIGILAEPWEYRKAKMSGRAETRTPEPPDRNEHENSPPRLFRPRRSTRPPNNYAQEQELDIEQSNALSQRKKKTQSKPVAQREVITSESSTESEDPNASELLKELVKLRKEIR